MGDQLCSRVAAGKQPLADLVSIRVRPQQRGGIGPKPRRPHRVLRPGEGRICLLALEASLRAVVGGVRQCLSVEARKAE